MMPLNLETLTDAGKVLFPKLIAFGDDFYLAGGTALALQLGHRVSVDFDLFSPSPIKKTLLAKVEDKLAEESLAPMVATSRELSVMIKGVKCTFLHYPFQVLHPFFALTPIRILSAKELLATKAYTIGRRGSLKDYVDLWAGIEAGVATLPEILELAGQKYTGAFNDRLFLEQLLYLDDVADEALLMLAHAQPSKSELNDFFSKLIQQFSV
jgi:predicted nucleotidyltransferase component of viral defense system